jgi:NAD(P)H-hydrate epimerase
MCTGFVLHSYNSYMTDRANRLYTAEQVRRLDKCAIDDHAIPGIDLMERAGTSALETARAAFPTARNYRVFCGGGNNGGDGYVVARLAKEAGLDVEVCALKDPGNLLGDAAIAATRWQQAGGDVQFLPLDKPDACDLVFDALLGTGLDREPAGDYAAAVDLINRSGSPVVSVDIPSGLNADTGVAMGRAVEADITVTFIGSKRGLFTADGPDYAGVVSFHDLETPQSVRDSEPDYGILIQQSLLNQLLPKRRRNSHKGSYGWMLGVGGNDGMSGAIRLAGEAALRSGAGKVTLATRSGHAGLINLGCPELMVSAVEQAGQLQALIEPIDVVVTGTGLGQTAWSEEMLRVCLKSAAPVVIDADGLNLLTRISSEPTQTRGRNWIMTPHPAEAARLLACSSREIQSDRVGAALRLAERFGAVIALKGCGTIVAEPNGRYAICPYGNPGMASAGTGDILAGIIGAMVAQGLDLWHATLAGVLAHALAGDLAAAQWGERGMLASDITAHLPAVLNPCQ